MNGSQQIANGRNRAMSWRLKGWLLTTGLVKLCDVSTHPTSRLERTQGTEGG